MDEILEQCPGSIGIADDIPVSNRSMRVAEQNGLTFNSEKCVIKWSQISFYGMIYNADGMNPDPHKVADLKAMLSPTCKKELQEFMSLITYLSAFI